MNAGGVIGLLRGEPLIGRIVLGALGLVADCGSGAVGPRAELPDGRRRPRHRPRTGPVRP